MPRPAKAIITATGAHTKEVTKKREEIETRVKGSGGGLSFCLYSAGACFFYPHFVY